MATKVVKEEVIRVRVDKDLKDRLKKMCKNKKITMSEHKGKRKTRAYDGNFNWNIVIILKRKL